MSSWEVLTLKRGRHAILKLNESILHPDLVNLATMQCLKCEIYSTKKKSDLHMLNTLSRKLKDSMNFEHNFLPILQEKIASSLIG